jgi:hypothetical protein
MHESTGEQNVAAGLATSRQASDYTEALKGAITLRDFFAGCALMGLQTCWRGEGVNHRDRAKLAYVEADAMLRARGEK